MNTTDEIELHLYRQWARGTAGADDSVPDAELRTAIERMIREPCEPWRERVERLGNIRADGIPLKMLWRLVLQRVASDPTAITKALLADRLDVDQRGLGLAQLIGMVGKVRR